MALGKKTGGRDFEPGNPGKPEGAKDLVPRSAKAAVAGLLERFGNDTAMIGQAIRDGITAKAPSSFPYLRMVIEQQVGAPEQPIGLTTTIVHEHHKASTVSE